MSKLLVMVGIQGSGKSTYSEKISKLNNNMPIISSDRIRDEISNIEEKKVFPLVYERIISCIRNNVDCIFDATSITKGARERLFTILKENNINRSNIEIIAYNFVPNLEESRKRVENRNKDKNERFLPIEVLDDYYNRFEEVEESEGFDKIIKINYKGEEI